MARKTTSKTPKVKSFNPFEQERMNLPLEDIHYVSLVNGTIIKEQKITNCNLVCVSAYDEEHHWNLLTGKGKKRKQIGEFVIYFRNDIACVGGSEIDYRHQGLGLGKAVYQTLAKLYKVLESDPNGSTSDEAANVWKALGATELRSGRYRLFGEKLDAKRKVSKTSKVRRKKSA